MEEARELREVLERVERKIFAAGKIYAAMNFAYWLAVMSMFYVILAFFRISGPVSIAYWVGAIVAGAIVSGILFRKIVVIARAKGDVEWRKSVGLMIALSWILGAVMGFYAVPSMFSASFGVALLTFLSVSLFGMWIVLGHFESPDPEMVPSFLVTAIGAAVAHVSGGEMAVWAGFVIAFAFSLTVLLYLYSAFRVIGD